jgi:hypothetical protein
MQVRNRKHFLSALTAGGAAVALAASAKAQPAQPAPPPPATPAPAAAGSPPGASGGKAAPTATASEKRPSAAALAVAATMRRFDPKLSDAQVERIARDIEGAGQLGPALNPKKKPLQNSDEPVTLLHVQP